MGEDYYSMNREELIEEIKRKDETIKRMNYIVCKQNLIRKQDK